MSSPTSAHIACLLWPSCHATLAIEISHELILGISRAMIQCWTVVWVRNSGPSTLPYPTTTVFTSLIRFVCQSTTSWSCWILTLTQRLAKFKSSNKLTSSVTRLSDRSRIYLLHPIQYLWSTKRQAWWKGNGEKWAGECPLWFQPSLRRVHSNLTFCAYKLLMIDSFKDFNLNWSWFQSTHIYNPHFLPDHDPHIWNSPPLVYITITQQISFWGSSSQPIYLILTFQDHFLGFHHQFPTFPLPQSILGFHPSLSLRLFLSSQIDISKL